MAKAKVVEEEVSDRAAKFNSLKSKYKDLNSYEVDFNPMSSDKILPTPSMHLNVMIGKDKGIRQGSIVTWYGSEGSLKTWTALEMCREAQKKWPEKAVAYLDAEYRVDLDSAINNIGIDPRPFSSSEPRFVYRRPHTAEIAWDMVRDFAATGQFSIIVVDSITTLRTDKQRNATEIKTGSLGSAARMNSQVLGDINPILEETGTILWLISQERVISFEPVVVTSFTGGNAINFYSTHIFRSKRFSRVWDEPSRELNVWLEKNKYGLSMRKTIIPVILGTGINQEGDLLEYASELGIIKKAGSWYSYKDEIIGQGVDKCSEIIKGNEDLKRELMDKVLSLV